MSIHQVKAIDVHGHVGCCNRPGKELVIRFQSGDAETVLRRAAQANTELTVISPLRGLMPRGKSDPVAANKEAAEIVSTHEGLLQWVIIDPRQPETFEQAKMMLQHPRCAGIKIHPEEHLYPIKEFGDAIFRFAAEHRAVVLTHSGEQNSLPEDFVPFADDYPKATLILAHIGCGYDGRMDHQVRAIQMSRAGNIYADTSSATSIVPNLIEWAVREIGVDRVLYGTDTPLYSAAMQRTRIDSAELDDAQKCHILRDNAMRVLNLP